MKLSTLIREPQRAPSETPHPDERSGSKTEPIARVHAAPEGIHQLERFHQKEHLLCLNQQEALMLFGLLQAASRHEPTRQTILSGGDYQQFHRQLSRSLAQSLTS